MVKNSSPTITNTVATHLRVQQDLHNARMARMQKRRAESRIPCKGRNDGYTCQKVASVAGRCITCHETLEVQRQQKYWIDCALPTSLPVTDACAICGNSRNQSIYLPGEGWLTCCSPKCYLATQ